MAKVEVRVLGARDVERAFKLLSDKASKDILRRAAKAGAQVIADEIKSLTAPRRTGRMLKAVRVKLDKKTRDFAQYRVGFTQKGRQAPIVEHGTGERTRKRGGRTGRMPKQPFVEPAFKRKLPEAERVVSEILLEAIERAAEEEAAR